MDLRAGEVNGRRKDVQALDSLDPLARIGDLHLSDEDVVQGVVQPVGIQSHGERQARLGVEIDEEHSPPEPAEGIPERMDGSRLGDATFLVGDRQHARHSGILRMTGDPCPGQQAGRVR